MWRRAGLALVFVWFLLGGIAHFVLTDAFVGVVPAYVPFPRAVVLVTGACEIVGALALLTPRLRPLAGLGLMAFIVCVTPVHVEMLMRAEQYAIGAPALWARLLFQPVLVWIVWRVTRSQSPAG